MLEEEFFSVSCSLIFFKRGKEDLLHTGIRKFYELIKLFAFLTSMISKFQLIRPKALPVFKSRKDPVHCSRYG
jgi:hypothetical protein